MSLLAAEFEKQEDVKLKTLVDDQVGPFCCIESESKAHANLSSTLSVSG